MRSYKFSSAVLFPVLVERVQKENIPCTLSYYPDGLGLVEAVERELPLSELEEICKSHQRAVTGELFNGMPIMPECVSVRKTAEMPPHITQHLHPHELKLKTKSYKIVLSPLNGINFYADEEILN